MAPAMATAWMSLAMPAKTMADAGSRASRALKSHPSMRSSTLGVATATASRKRMPKTRPGRSKGECFQAWTMYGILTARGMNPRAAARQSRRGRLAIMDCAFFRRYGLGSRIPDASWRALVRCAAPQASFPGG